MMLTLDSSGSAPGRGAYVCPSAECYDRALAKKAFVRKLAVSSEHQLLREDFIRMLKTRR